MNQELDLKRELEILYLMYDIEMKKLNHDRNIKMQELGSHIFTQYKSKSLNITELLANDESQKILSELEVINKEIVKLGKKIKRNAK